MEDESKLIIGNDSWKGFQGMFIYYNECGLIGYYYKIYGSYYNAMSLVKEDIYEHSYQSGCDLMDSFTIDPNGSKILVINISGQGLLYQQLSNKIFQEILPMTEEEDRIAGTLEEAPYTLKVPLPNGKEIDGVFQEFLLTPIDNMIIQKIENYAYNEDLDEHSEIDERELLLILNS